MRCGYCTEGFFARYLTNCSETLFLCGPLFWGENMLQWPPENRNKATGLRSTVTLNKKARKLEIPRLWTISVALFTVTRRDSYLTTTSFRHPPKRVPFRREQEKPTNCGTKAADVVAFLGRRCYSIGGLLPSLCVSVCLPRCVLWLNGAR